MSRRHPPLAERRPENSTHATQAALHIGGDGLSLGVAPVRLFRPDPTRVVLVGSPRCAQLVAYRALATGAGVTVGTARPHVWSALSHAAGVPILPIDAEPEEGRRTRPLLHVDDAPPYGREPVLPGTRWTTVLTLREALTHREVPLIEHADLLLLQHLRPAEVEVLTSAYRVPGVDQRLAQLPADALTVAHRQGARWGHLAVTPVEHHYFGPVHQR